MSSPFDVFAAAREVPDQIALVEPAKRWSYAELALLSERALGWLRARGLLDPAQPVAVLAEPTPQQIAMTFALMASGVPCLPVHPRLTEPERAALIAEVGAPLTVDTAWQNARVSVSEPALAPRPSADGAGGEAPLALVQTSGTSAGPRLAMLSARAFRASAAASAAHLGWQPGDRWLLALPFAHIGGLSILTRCLAARSTIALAAVPTPAARRAAPAGRAATLAESFGALDVSLASLVPTQLEQLLDLDSTRWRAARLRALLVGGAAAPSTTLERARARGLPVLPTYGMTETCSQICTRAVTAEPDAAGVGRPLAGVEVAIRAGEIHVRGAMLFSGYWGESQRYTPATWFPTGDLGHIDASGCLHVLGRISDRIISGGENVNPLELEELLSAAVAPRRLCVFGRNDPLWGEQVAIAIEGPVDPALVERLAHISRTCLASFKRPRLVTFVAELPVLGSGKILRRALKESESLSFSPIVYTSG